MNLEVVSVLLLVCLPVVVFLIWTVRQQGNYLSLLGNAHNELRRACAADFTHLNERFIEATNQRGVGSFATPATPKVPAAPSDALIWPESPGGPDLPAQ